ncbi:MAG: hypothetical protein LBM77_07840 [Spirochaetaceae bacterium]|jgi:hypothetical protein|nr:hypothetical protein [Spirochaetaceae bacterium]
MCWYCGTAITDSEPLGHSLVCNTCGKDLRCCFNCRFFKPGEYNDCNEGQAERVVDKERANFCDWFKLNPDYRVNHSPKGKKNNANEKTDAKKAFGSLFSI